MRTVYKRLRIWVYIFLFINLGVITTFITLDSINFFEKYHYLSVVFSIITPALLLIWSFILTLDIELRSSFKALHKDNLYYLGRESDFYTFSLFEREAARILRRRKKEQVYLISFTACGQEVSANLVRNDTVIEFNYYISEMIMDYFKANRLHKHLDSTYCYYKDSFALLIVGDENRANKVIKDFETKIYDIAKEHSLRIFVQPFFGIADFDRTQDLNVNFENATLSRLHSERNFELATYYNDSLRFKASNSESQEIIDALKNDEFLVYYQPKFSLTQKRFISSEALIRWNSKEYGLLPPSRFIAKAEAAGLIHDIDMYVFQKVCEDLNDFKKRGKRTIPVSINFSLYEFYSPNFVEDIIKIIDKNYVQHSLIEIEITETTTQSNPFLSISIMKKLKEQGIRVLMDDFGVGYSNFANFRKMPIDSVKIDKSFIDEIIGEEKTREIVKFIISLAKVNELEAIAEGVDNEEQVNILKKAKIDTIQGYYYSKPLPKKEYEAFLIENPFEKKGAAEQ